MVRTPFEQLHERTDKRSKRKHTSKACEPTSFSTAIMYNATQQSLLGRVPLDVREACRDLLYYLRKRPELMKKPSPRGFKEYDNREGFLPKITRKESWSYYEAVVGSARDGSTGKRRVVLLIEGNSNNFKRCLGKYYSNTHYGHRHGDVPFVRVN